MPPLLRRLPNLIALLGLALLAAFTWADQGPSRAFQWPWFLYSQLLMLLPVVWLVAHTAILGRFHRFGHGLDGPMLAFAATMIAATIGSPYPEACAVLLPAVVVPVTLAYAVQNWLESPSAGDRTARLANGGGLALVLTSVLMLLAWFLRDVIPARGGGASWLAALASRNDQLLGHTVYVSGIGLLTTAWLAGLARERSGRSRFLCLAGAGVGLVQIITAGSRSGFVGLTVWLIWFLYGEARRLRWTWYRTLFVAVLLGGGVAAVVSLHPRVKVILRQWQETRTLNSGDRQRLAMAQFGSLILRERPLLGIGPGATPLVYPRYRARLSGGVESALQLHSTPVQWAADGGWCGLAAAACIVTTLWWRRRRDEPAFAAGTLLAYAAFALTDYQLDLPVFGFTVGVLLALCARTPASIPGPGSTVGRPASPEPQSAIRNPHSRDGLAVAGRPVALVLVGLVGLFLFLQHDHWRARATFSEGMEALHQGDVAAFNQGMVDARKYDPTSIYYQNLQACVLAEIRAYPLWFPPVDVGADRLDRAVALFEESLAIDPYQELPHTHLAWLLLPRDPAAAAKHFRAAAQTIPDKGGLYFGLGLALLAQNRADAAAQALALELVNDPAFVASPEWLALVEIPELSASARRLAATRLEQIADQAGPLDALRVVRRARYAAALLHWLDGNAAALARARALAEPEQLNLLDWLSGQAVTPPAESPIPWHALARAAARSTQAEEELQSYFARRRAPAPEIVLAMARALQTPDRRSLLLLPPETSPQLIPHYYRERLAYPLLMRNLDAPAPRDPHVVPENRFVRDFLFPLFPEKGFLPAPVLAAELARLPE